MLAVGIFAFAIKKKTGDAYAYLSAGSDNYLLRFPKMSAPEVRALFTPYKSLFGAESRERAAAVVAAVVAAEAAAEREERISAANPRMTCPACQQVLLAKLTKCWKCGAAVEAPREPTAPGTTVSCPFCAEEIQSAAIKCKHCGEFLPDSR
jgi:predicted nucleic-acid-binding Zn-ribbon protein